MRVADDAGWVAQRAVEEAQRAARAAAAAQAAAEAARIARAATADIVERAASPSPFAPPAPAVAAPAPAAGPSPDVQAAVDQVRAQSDPYQKAESIQFHLQVHAEDPPWRTEFLRALGPEETGRAVASVDPTQYSPSSFETARSLELLSAASQSYAPDELRGCSRPSPRTFWPVSSSTP